LFYACTPRIPEIHGTAYFLDCENGDDSHSGTSRSRTWATLGAVNRFTFEPGDGIFLKRGTLCKGTLKPQGSGKENLPIIVDAYGRGAIPVIDGGNYPEAVRLVGQEYWEISNKGPSHTVTKRRKSAALLGWINPIRYTTITALFK
jgi:hypothetical protein